MRTAALRIASRRRYTGTYADYMTSLAPTSWWRLGEASGTNAADSSGNGHTASYVGSPTLGVSGLISDSNTAVTLDGSTQHVSCPALAIGSGGITLMGWVSTGTDKSEYIISHSGRAYLRRTITTGQVFFSWFDSGSVQRTLGGVKSVCPANGTVHMYVATHDGTTARLYLDGSQILSSALSFLAVPSATWAIGRAGTGGADWWNGTIDEVAIWDGVAISGGAIRDLYSIGRGLG